MAGVSVQLTLSVACLSYVQIQMRDLPGFVDTRQKLLQVKPSNRSHWITLAVAHHANKSYETAVKVRRRLHV